MTIAGVFEAAVRVITPCGILCFGWRGLSLVQVGVVTVRKTTTRTTGGKVREGNGNCYETEELSFRGHSKPAAVVTEIG